jgi:hypothetical protein
VNLCQAIFSKPGTIINYLKADDPSNHGSDNFHLPSVFPLSDPVAYRILYQGLEYHPAHFNI